MGRGDAPGESAGRFENPGDGRTADSSRSDFGVRRTLLIVGVPTDSGVAAVDIERALCLTGVEVSEGFGGVLFEIESRTLWNLRFLDSKA